MKINWKHQIKVHFAGKHASIPKVADESDINTTLYNFKRKSFQVELKLL